MRRTLGISATAIALVVGMVTTAHADTIITTDRVQVTVGENGDVQVRTGGTATLPQGLTPANSVTPSASTVRLLGCNQRSQQIQDYAVTGNGDRVVSQSQSRMVICQ